MSRADVIAERRAQGLPPTVNEAAVMRQLATLIADTPPRHLPERHDNGAVKTIKGVSRARCRTP